MSTLTPPLTFSKTVHTVSDMHTSENISDLRPHFEKHFSHLARTYRTVLKTSQLEVRSYAPDKEHPFELLTTFGLSQVPSQVPESWQNTEEPFADTDWNELMLCLNTSITETDRLWAAQLLLSVGECAQKENRYLASGQFFELIPSAEKPWRAAVISIPEQPKLSSLASFRTSLSQRCYWLCVIPVLREELSVLKNEGYSAFEKQLRHNHVNEVFMPERISFTIPRNASLMYA